ncbi:MAG TPA: hypothetical protein VG274_02575 [Rhizomicrobium sp.]|jgi:hypothetical protein|nr:hypothetical protein [Rhizomicrobium sp.]
MQRPVVSRDPEKTAAQFFKRRVGKARPRDLLSFLQNTPAKSPLRGDEALRRPSPYEFSMAVSEVRFLP